MKKTRTKPRALAGNSADDYDGVAIMAPELPEIRDAIHRMRERGIHTIPFISNQNDEGSGFFVGIDNHAVGSIAGLIMWRFLGVQTGTIAVVTDTMRSRDSLERRLGFDSVINTHFPAFKVLPSLETHSDTERIYQIIETVFTAHDDLVALYIMGSETREILEAREVFGHTHRPHLKIAQNP